MDQRPTVGQALSEMWVPMPVGALSAERLVELAGETGRLGLHRTVDLPQDAPDADRVVRPARRVARRVRGPDVTARPAWTIFARLDPGPVHARQRQAATALRGRLGPPDRPRGLDLG